MKITTKTKHKGTVPVIIIDPEENVIHGFTTLGGRMCRKGYNSWHEVNHLRWGEARHH